MSSPSYIYSPTADVILRSPLEPGSDEFMEFRVHKLALSVASAVFRDTFSTTQLPCYISDDTKLDVVEITASAEVVETFLQFVYPVIPPVIEDPRLVDDLFQLADKYAANGIMETLKNLLVSPSFLEGDPIGAFAVACRNNLYEEAEVAIPYTFSVEIASGTSDDNLQLMTTTIYHRLVVEHARRRDQLIDVVSRAQHSWEQISPCRCGDGLSKEIYLQLSRRPFFNGETFEECLSLARKPNHTCRGAKSNCILTPGVADGFLSDIEERIERIDGD